ncbi:hypothetical protein BIY23_03270 [Wolbachia pipientis]|uniref:Cell shape-determining protein MreC n=2 Tax=Wolbachia pipientis TaxID=955 RepID=A0A1E7QJB0_WOLPI|nr:hypothetical protein BIY23_03270 [Wolbachia pipientis]
MPPLFCIKNSFIKSVKKCTSEDQVLVKEEGLIMEDTLANKVLTAENLRLKKLLNFLSSYDGLEYVTTHVTITNVRGAIFIAAGTEHGIQKDQLIINEDGLVGKVIDVNKLSARLLPLNNKNFHIPVMIVESGMKAIAVGTNSDYLQLLYLPTRAQEGNMVVTAVNNLPKIYVGQVIKNNRIKSNINLKQIDFVSIVKPR